MVRASSSLFMKVLIFFFLLTVSCEKESGLAGKYASANDMTQKTTVANLELMADGRGAWSIEEDSVSFNWEVRKGKIWLHTKSGGVIVGTITGDTLTVNLPGMGVHRFNKVKE
ncbi:MAG: hypothetical protein KKH68_05920 [Proteobacteria bacterium]|nr:hypothetical protein [Pseudomonadota bacterium]